MVERVKTGVPGLDEFVEGGFPEGSVTLVTGGAGSGKTTFCIQFLTEGLENGENCLYLSTGQSPEEIRRDAKDFGIDLDNYYNNLSMTNVNPSREFEEDVIKYIQQEEFDRIVLDSLSIFDMYWGEKDELRKHVNRLVEELKDLEATVVVTSELPEKQSGRLTRFGIAEFAVDGVIRLEGFALGEATYRSMQVVKMRRTPVSGDILKVSFVEGEGIRVEADETV